MSFSRLLLMFRVESECLLDGSTGPIPAASVLQSAPAVHLDNSVGDRAESRSNNFCLVALSNEQSTFVVSVDPDISVLFKWNQPKRGVRECGEVLPCLSWGWAHLPGTDGTLHPALLRGWGTCIELLQCSFRPRQTGPRTLESGNIQAAIKPAFDVKLALDASAEVVAVEWLGDKV